MKLRVVWRRYSIHASSAGIWFNLLAFVTLAEGMGGDYGREGVVEGAAKPGQ